MQLINNPFFAIHQVFELLTQNCPEQGRFRSLVSEVSKRGWRTEGVGATRSFLSQRFRPLFCILFPIPPYEKGNTILGTFLALFWFPASRQPPPANPFSKLLIVKTKLALSKTGRFLSKAEILGVGSFPPLFNFKLYEN